jgi:hypothetical protein
VQNEGEAQKGVIVGAIPCPVGVTKTKEVVNPDNEVVNPDNVVGMINDDHEDEEVDENVEVIDNANEEVIVRTEIEERVTKEPIVAKEPIVYYRKRFKSQGEQVRSQGEQVGAPQPYEPVSPVPNLSSALSPSSTQSGSSGNVPHIPEHVELSLAQRRDTRSNFGKPPVCYGFEYSSIDHCRETRFGKHHTHNKGVTSYIYSQYGLEYRNAIKYT